MTDADSSTDTTVRWTKNTPKPEFVEKRKESFKTQKLKNIKKYAKISDTPFDQKPLIHREEWFPGEPGIPKKKIFFFFTEKIIQNAKMSRDMLKLAIRPSTRRPLIVWEVWFPTRFVGQNQQKNNFFVRQF